METPARKSPLKTTSSINLFVRCQSIKGSLMSVKPIVTVLTSRRILLSTPESRGAVADQDLDCLERGTYHAATGVPRCAPDSACSQSIHQGPFLPPRSDPAGAVQQTEAASKGGVPEACHLSAQSSTAKEGTGNAAAKAPMAQPSKSAQPFSRSEDDVEKGHSPHDRTDAPVDFLGGFSLNSCFDPHMDV